MPRASPESWDWAPVDAAHSDTRISERLLLGLVILKEFTDKTLDVVGGWSTR